MFGCARSSLCHLGSFTVACKLLVAACGIQFPEQGSNSTLCNGSVEFLSHWTTKQVPIYFFFLNFIYFIEVQLIYNVNFYCRAKWFTYIYTYIYILFCILFIMVNPRIFKIWTSFLTRGSSVVSWPSSPSTGHVTRPPSHRALFWST